MIDDYDVKTEFTNKPDSETLLEIKELCKENSLTFESNLDETLLIRIKKTLAATGSISGNVLKCIVVKEEFKNQNLTGKIVAELINREYRKGKTDLFLFTKPENRKTFTQLGFFPVYDIKGSIVLMENNPSKLDNYLEKLKKESENKNPVDGRIGSIVVNCNPITKGHLYLIEKAASQSEILHLFVVSEDRSIFPFDVRYQLIKEATAYIKNIILHKGGNYIISNATFPSYFIKDLKQVIDFHAKLDLGIFSEKIASALGITARFAGDEPLCPVTDNYNRLMKEILPAHGIEFYIIKRLEIEGEPVSASKVRKLFFERDFGAIKRIVPPATYNFLVSAEGDEILEKFEEEGK